MSCHQVYIALNDFVRGYKRWKNGIYLIRNGTKNSIELYSGKLTDLSQFELHWDKYDNWFNLFFTIISALPITFLTLALVKTGGASMTWVWASLLSLSLLATAFIIRMITRNASRTEIARGLKKIDEKLNKLDKLDKLDNLTSKEDVNIGNACC